MQYLLTKEDARQFFGFKTIEATEKMLQRLHVPKVDFSIVGGKGIRYRRSDLEEALSKIEVRPKSSGRISKRRRPRTDIFDLSVNEQLAILSAEKTQQ
ncbi:hypothetical protein [uncultured Desulfovibrio sp.]|uniref:hypothetical protein n=1 Tax=uncultured Desulfovibrio sp. TaxID=167968 RepID=UPI002605C9F2|nr:hypothetical protein [uncultured Desulfovibrio sp.]